MKNTHRILLVEENFKEVLLLDRAFHEAGIVNPVQIVRHFQEAICYLNGIGIYSNRNLYPLPSLMLIAIGTRKGVGFSLLAWLHAHGGFKNIPVVAINHGGNQVEVQEVYDLGASAYFEWKNDRLEIINLIQDLDFIEDIWLPKS